MRSPWRWTSTGADSTRSSCTPFRETRPAKLRREFEESIKMRLNPLLARVHEVVLVPELPQAGPGKTRTMAELRRDYLARAKRS